MGCDVITLGRALGAGGEDLGAALAKDLGFRYVDSEIITRAAERAGVSEETVARAEGRKSLTTRIMEHLAALPVQAGTGEMIVVPPVAEGYEQVIVDVVKEVAGQGKVVLVAHGAAYALARRAGLLRVLVTASEDTRAARLAADTGVSAGEARKMVSESDKARHEFLRRFYRVEQELPTHYDLVVNTDVLSIPHAEAAILATARA